MEDTGCDRTKNSGDPWGVEWVEKIILSPGRPGDKGQWSSQDRDEEKRDSQSENSGDGVEDLLECSVE